MPFDDFARVIFGYARNIVREQNRTRQFERLPTEMEG